MNLNARKTLEWLDHITSATENNKVGRVELQGPDDQYQTWREVERYLLPDTPLSSSGLNSLDELTEGVRDRLRVDGSRPVVTSLRDSSNSGHSTSPNSSPDLAPAAVAFGGGAQAQTSAESRRKRKSGTAGIPPTVRPLLNFVVWRTYHGDLTIVGSGKYILLTNDRTTQKLAQKFGVRAKLLSQMNTIVSKGAEARKLNGTAVEADAVRASLDGSTTALELDELPEDEGDEEIVFDPSLRPGSSRGVPTSPKVMDPDHFGRRTAGPAVVQPTATAQANPMPKSNFRGRGRGATTGAGPGRANVASQRGRGQQFPRGGTRGVTGVRGQHSAQQSARPIDPDSYARPSSTRGGRGASKRLFDPHNT